MARPKSKLTAEQKRERAKAYAAEYRKRQKAGKVQSRDLLATEINRVKALISARGQALLDQAIASKSISEAMASFGDAAGKDTETTALLTLLATLQQAQSARDLIAAGKHVEVIEPPVAAPKPAAKKSKRA